MAPTHDDDSGRGDGLDVVAGFILGALLGAGVALLVAPRAGREVRRDVADGWRRLRVSVRDRVDEFADAAGVELADLSQAVEHLDDGPRPAPRRRPARTAAE